MATKYSQSANIKHSRKACHQPAWNLLFLNVPCHGGSCLCSQVEFSNGCTCMNL